MKRKELEELLKNNTKEDNNIDIEAVFEQINKHVNEISAKNIEKERNSFKDEVSSEVKNEFIKQYGFENVDQFGAFVKNSKASATETSEALSRVQTEYDNFKETYSSLEKQYKEVNNELTSMKNLKLAREIGVKDDFLDFALFEAQKLVNEETSLSDAFGNLRESKPYVFGDKEVKVGKEVKGKKVETKSPFLEANERLKKGRRIF